MDDFNASMTIIMVRGREGWRDGVIRKRGIEVGANRFSILVFSYPFPLSPPFLP
jgi:hypothetical protein